MKKCHVCGQKLPLKVGEMVEFRTQFLSRRWERGIVTAAPTGGYASVLSLFDGCGHELDVSRLTRLHGYYRITEREPLV